MTAAALPQAEVADCPSCGGAGEVGDGTRDLNGIYGTRDCTACQGSGIVPAEAVAGCSNCGTDVWSDQVCDHGMTLCSDCALSCRECSAEAGAEREYDYAREALAFFGVVR